MKKNSSLLVLGIVSISLLLILSVIQSSTAQRYDDDDKDHDKDKWNRHDDDKDHDKEGKKYDKDMTKISGIDMMTTTTTVMISN